MYLCDLCNKAFRYQSQFLCHQNLKKKCTDRKRKQSELININVIKRMKINKNINILDNTIIENKNLQSKIKTLENTIVELSSNPYTNTKPIIMNQYINNFPLNINEHIYIASTKILSIYNKFKIGRTVNIKTRLSGYNTGRLKDDKYFYCAHFKCCNSKSLESRIFDKLQNFKIPNESEMYQLHYDKLYELIKNIIDRDNQDILEINNFLKNDYESCLQKTPYEF